MNTIILAVAVGGILIFLDFIWFYFSGNLFKAEIGSILRLSAGGDWSVLYLPAGLTYVFMSLGVVLLVYPQATSLAGALALGALFGLITYGIYDTTNLATLSAWTWKLAVVDMLWGTFLMGTASAAAFLIGRQFFG